MTKNMKKMFIQLECLLSVIFFLALSKHKATPHSSQTQDVHTYLFHFKFVQITQFFLFPLGSFVCFIWASGFNNLLGISVDFLPGLIQVRR